MDIDSWNRDNGTLCLTRLDVDKDTMNYLSPFQKEKYKDGKYVSIMTWQNYDQNIDQLWKLGTDGRLHNLGKLTLGNILRVSRKRWAAGDPLSEKIVKEDLDIDYSTGVIHEKWTS